jgi:sec-independent protein translocase protein TatA
MGISGINPASLLLILLIILVLFGTKRLRNIGEDLGKALRGFRKGMDENEQMSEQKNIQQFDKTKDQE